MNSTALFASYAAGHPLSSSDGLTNLIVASLSPPRTTRLGSARSVVSNHHQHQEDAYHSDCKPATPSWTTLLRILSEPSPGIPHLPRQHLLRLCVRSLVLQLRRAKHQRNLGPVPRALNSRTARPELLVRPLASVQVPPRLDPASTRALAAAADGQLNTPAVIAAPPSLLSVANVAPSLFVFPTRTGRWTNLRAARRVPWSAKTTRPPTLGPQPPSAEPPAGATVVSSTASAGLARRQAGGAAAEARRERRPGGEPRVRGAEGGAHRRRAGLRDVAGDDGVVGVGV